MNQQLRLPRVTRAEAWVEAVINGSQPACAQVRQAAERHRADLERAARPDARWVFDRVRAERACRMIETLVLWEGEAAGQRLRLLPAHAFIVASLFGWVDATTGLRRFRTAYFELPRKNAKSVLMGGIGLCALAFDDEPGPQVLSAATTQDQARIVLKHAQRMAAATPELVEWGVEPRTHDIRYGPLHGEFRALASQTRSLDGLNPHCAIVDELHMHPNREVLDVIKSGQGSRRQPLTLMITTAGADTTGVCHQERDYLAGILGGRYVDDAYFGLIFTVDPGDDPGDPATWAKCNPGLGITVSEDYLAGEWRQATRSRAKMGEFLRKHLNIWTTAGAVAFDMDGWRRGVDPALRRADWCGPGREGAAVIGVDLSTTRDMTSLATLMWDGPRLLIWADHFVTEAVAREPGNEQLAIWGDEGRLTICSGALIDQAAVTARLAERIEAHWPHSVVFDKFNAAAMMENVDRRYAGAGVQVVPLEQRPSNISEAFERLQGLVIDGRVVTDGDPVLAWMASNTIDKHAGRWWMPDKDRSWKMIDGIDAALNALVFLDAPSHAPAARLTSERIIARGGLL